MVQWVRPRCNLLLNFPTEVVNEFKFYISFIPRRGRKFLVLFIGKISFEFLNWNSKQSCRKEDNQLFLFDHAGFFACSIQGRGEICLGEEDEGAFNRAGRGLLLSPTCRSSLPPCCSHWAPWLTTNKFSAANCHHWEKSSATALEVKFNLPAPFVPPFFNLWRILVIHNNYMVLLSFRSQCSSQEVENILFSRYRKEVIKGHSVVVSGK